MRPIDLLHSRERLRPPTLVWLWFWAAILACGGLSAQERPSVGQDPAAFRQAHPSIRYAADPDFAPIDFVQSGRHQGLSKDYLDAVARHSGLHFERVNFDSWDEALQAFRAGQIDLLTSLFVSDEREQFALFSEPYLRPGASLLTRAGEAPIRNLAELGSRQLGIVAGSVWFEMLGEDAARLNLRNYPRLSDALRALVDGEVDAVISDPVTGLEQSRRRGLDGRVQVSADLDMEVPIAFGIRPDWPMLQRIINSGFDQIGVDEEARLRGRWIATADDAAPATTELVPVHIPDSERARMEAVLAALEEADEAGRQLLQEALAIDAQTDALLTDLQQRSEAAEPAASVAPAAPQESDLQRFLLWRASLPERASVDELQRMLRGEEAALQTVEARRDQAALQLRDLRQRQIDAPSEIERAQEVATGSDELVPSSANPTPAQWLAKARRRLALTRVAALQQEIGRLPTAIIRVEHELEQARRDLSRYRQRVQALQELQRDRVVREAEARVAEVERATAALQNPAPDVLTRAEQSLELAQRTVALAERYADAVPALLEESQKAERVARSLDLTRQRLALQAGGAELGRVLAAERRSLDPPREAAVLRQAIDEELAQLRLEQIELGAAQAELVDEDGPLRLDADEDDDGGAMSSQWQRQEMVARQRQLTTEALELSSLLQGTLEATRRELVRRERDSLELRDRIDERLLWLPTQSVLVLEGWHPWQALLDLAKASRWAYSARLIARDVESRPWTLATVVAGVLLVWWLRRGWRQRLQHLDEDARPRKMWPALQALLLATLSAAFWPALCVLLGRYLQGLGEPGKFTDSLGGSLVAIAPNFLLLASIRWYALPGGLPRLLGWEGPRALALHRLATQLLWIVLPVSLINHLQLLRGSQLGIDGLARPLLILMTLAIAWLLWRATAPGEALAWQHQLARNTAGEQLRRKAHVILPGALVLLALLQLAGYGLVSFMVLQALAYSLYLLLWLMLVHRLVLRWLLLQEQRLAEQRYREQLEARQAEAAEEGDSSDAPPRAERPEVTLASISSQARRLLRATLWTGGALGLLAIWSGLLPALQALDGMTLWQLAATEADGVARSVSLLDGLLCLATLILTTIAARNLPGLLEIGLLQRMPVDNATRYAVTSLCRYVIVIGGLVYGISLLGVRWGHLQWMAAALTVGLGFGLQEIFANFVSGLILLFERPFRVGDTITIGELSGTVTRIRTRATTILDWDNREIMVPNKTFITDDLVNWTLSDTTTRITLKVGTAYGSDPDRVLALLREVAEAHPRVLPEPKPTSWLMAFGASSIDFELRVFVAEIRDRLPVSTELATQIHRRFRAEGIEIPFPQVDLHVRTPPPPPKREGEGTAPASS